MSHILKKIAIAGAGGGSRRPKPPIYKPPVLGELQYGASHSYAETLDLVSDGPIEGLVDRDGISLDGLGIFKGIYFDDTPVAVSNRRTTTSNNRVTEIEAETADSFNMRLDNDTTNSPWKMPRYYFRALDHKEARVANKEGSGPLTRLSAWKYWYNRSQRTNRPQDLEPNLSPDRAVFMFQNQTTVTDEGEDYWRSVLGGRGAFDMWFRSTGGTKLKYGNHINGTLTNPRISRSGYFAPLWTTVTDYGDHAAEARNLNNLYFFDALNEGHDLSWAQRYFRWNRDESFLVCMQAQALKPTSNGGGTSIEEYFPGTYTKVASFISDEIFKIKKLVTDNEGDDGNVLQRRLAKKALGVLGGSGGGTEDLVRQLLGSYAAPDERSVAERETMPIHNRGIAHAFIVIMANKKDGTTINGVQQPTSIYPVENTELVGNVVAAGGATPADQLMHYMSTIPYGTELGWSVNTDLQSKGVEIFDITCPVIEPNGNLEGTMHGCVIYKVPLDITARRANLRTNNVGTRILNVFSFSRDIIDTFQDIESFRYAKTKLSSRIANSANDSDLKFNFSNVLAEVRKGEQFQPPFNHFRTVFIDHPYSRELFGPFSATRTATPDYNHPNHPEVPQRNAPQRITPNTHALTWERVGGLDANNFNTTLNQNLLPDDEGSDDYRVGNDGQENFSDWAGKSFGDWDEDAVPVVHTVYNPNVTRAFITINIAQLSDTLIKDNENIAATEGGKGDAKIGTKFPTVLNLKVETGTLGLDEEGNEGLETPYQTYLYRVVALIDNPTLIDIGNPDYEMDSEKEYVVNLSQNDPNLNAGFALPPTVATKQLLLSANGERGIEAGVIDQDSTEKRYIKVTKLSFETNSVLISKAVQLTKVTEIIDVPLPYPFSAIIGTKIDSRSFSSIPTRTYDLKLKKVKVPSNYFPTHRDGRDKRYYNTQKQFTSTSKKDKLVYDGDWDGSFKEHLEWTDNPAWILYDLLTNYRYGMGAHIDATDINKWQLYTIGRFCDAVDENGYFEGVTDGRGGKEPRFSSNIVFDKGQKIFDAITLIAALFRGRVFFGSSEINFVDDRPRTPVNLFTNENVKDGLFFYSNNRRDEQFNCIEVGYRDRFDNFVPKIEVVEDEESIKEKGIFKKRIEGVGITSRAMARRVAQHQIFSKIKENQQVAFTAGLETLLCKPGDLVLIEDDLKTNITNYGKILAVDPTAETIRMTNTFVDADMSGVLTIMDPTGRDSSLDITTGLGYLKRERYYELSVTGESEEWVRYAGNYGFSGYTEGYPDCGESYDTRYKQYALYTGIPSPISGKMLYFNKGVTGWVFASGSSEGTGAFALGSGDFISQWTGSQSIADIGTGYLVEMTMVGDKRSTDPSDVHLFSGAFDNNAFAPSHTTAGALDSEILALNHLDQLKPLYVTGNILSTEEELTGAGFNNYGSVVSGFDQPHLLPYIKLGSVAKFDIQDATPFIYKVLTMKEENPNEYLVTASKYDTGKFKLIEEDISIEREANTFSYQRAQMVNGINYETLPTPQIASLTTGEPDAATKTFTISGMWGQVDNSTGYHMSLTHPNGAIWNKSIDPSTATGGQFSDLRQVGVFNFCVTALGNKGGDGGNAYFDSQKACSGIFVVYDERNVWDVSFLNRITIG